ncbi:MFS transporter [Defluviimonas sp. WL0002]|uniref:MFS transporter n=1 Tax=Albidovulum marisflavi TaxID=2984159 RepID=A0ABT2ZF14_9RHOB|nr:MFS transporter [Defluviimonas sp. WL0002]MCV2869714.1 MFS transporter [Defluviimonas sp. WL0002]
MTAVSHGGVASLVSAARLSRASSLGLMAVGVFWGAFAAYIPDIKSRVGAPDGAFGLALMMAAAGAIVSMQAAPRVLARFGRATMPAAGVVAALFSLSPLAAGDTVGLGIALFLMGASIAMIDITSNIRLSLEEAATGLPLMNLSHAAFSLAFALAAFAAAHARQAGWPPEAFLPLSALVILALGIGTAEGASWRAAPAVPEGASPLDGIMRAVWPVAIILFLAFICENATDSWSALHIERTLGAPIGFGGYGPAMLGLTMGIGRLGGQVAAQRLGEVSLILWSAVVGAFGAILTALAWAPWVGVAGVAFLGFGSAVLVPSANTILGRLVRPDQRGLALSRAWMFGFAGFFIGPSLMGQVSDAFGLRWAFGTIALLMAAILPVTIHLARLQTRLR